MTGEGATMATMTSPVGDSLAPFQARLRRFMDERGIQPADVPEGETADDVAERRATQAQNRARRWLARLPVMYAEARLDALDEDQHAGDLRRFMDSDRLTLILTGTIGSGKTYAAYAVGNDAVARGYWTEAVAIHDLMAALRPEGDRDLADACRRCQVLILDDLGAGKVSEFAVDEITALMDTRIRDGLRTVITTNQTARTLGEVYGERLISRLGYRSLPLVFRGVDRRPQW